MVLLGPKGLESRRGNSTEFNQRLSALNKLGGKSKKRLVLLYAAAVLNPANISVYCQIHMSFDVNTRDLKHLPVSCFTLNQHA